MSNWRVNPGLFLLCVICLLPDIKINKMNNQETFNTWNKVAQIYADKFMPMDVYNESYDLLIKAIAGNDAKVLDIACGPGNITRYILAQQPGFLIHGIDVAPEMIRLARQFNPSATFEVMQMNQLPDLKEKYDAVICGFGIPYLTPEERKIFIRHVKQLLTDKGVFYLSFVAGEVSLSGRKTNSMGDSVYFNYHPEKEVLQDLHQNGFRVLHDMDVHYQNSEEHKILICESV